MRRSCSALVTPPDIRGTTEKVPSFWMLACTRSLMNRASRSSTYSPPHTSRSSDASAGLAFASSQPPASAANTSDTERRSAFADRGHQRRACASGCRGRTSRPPGPPRARRRPPSSTMSRPAPCTSRSPLPARVLAITPRQLPLAAAHAGDRIAPLDTPLQLQTCASSASSATLSSAAGPPRSNSSSTRSSGSGGPAVEACMQERRPSPCRPAASRRPACRRARSPSCRPRGPARRTRTNSSSDARARCSAHRRDVDAGHLELRGDACEPWYAALGSAPVIWSASTSPAPTAARPARRPRRGAGRTRRRRRCPGRRRCASGRRRRSRAPRSARTRRRARRWGGCRRSNTTMSHVDLEPSAKITASTGSPRTADRGRAAAGVTPMPIALDRGRRIAAGLVVELLVHQHRPRGAPRARRRPCSSSPHAASRPSRPPPMTHRGPVPAARTRASRWRRRACGRRRRRGVSAPRRRPTCRPSAGRTSGCRWR